MRASRRLRACAALAVLAAAGAAAGCATAPPDVPSIREPAFGAAWTAAPGAVPMDALRVPNDVRDLVLTVYPTPRRADYADVLLPLDGARYVDEGSEDVDAVLRAAGLELGFRELPAEGFALAVTSDGERTVVLTAARDEPGRTWASLALEQLTTTHDGRRVVRACRVLDAPVFALRGNKRPQPWERRYRANFAWEAREGDEYDGRELVATVAPGSPLDASREAVESILAAWRPWQDRGVRRFCVKFDDVGFGMTPDTEARSGTYGAAMTSFVARVRAGLQERDPEARLWFLPQTYWWNDEMLGPYARALRAAGGLPPDVGLVMTGPEIISARIDAAGLASALAQFGTVETPALIYDNLGREGDWGPLAGRDPALATLCAGVFGERGTPVHRLTRLDWLWNPGTYDPERSWRRAILELAGPAGYADLLGACGAFRRKAAREDAAALVERFAATAPPASADAAMPVPRARLANLLRGDLGRLPPRAPLPVATRIPRCP